MTITATNSADKPKPYVGRFAPSPSGPLHFGSLITALGSYLRARQNNGKWLLRIDDIDPPREMPGAKQAILDTLQCHGLEWDDEVIYQSERKQNYLQALATLTAAGKSYFCQCTRKQIKQGGGHYPGTCRHLGLEGDNLSVRFSNDSKVFEIDDGLLGKVAIDTNIAQEDFVIWRKDGLVAYNLASVVDDIEFGVTEVVRGADLLAPSASQNSLFEAFATTAPHYIHLPVAVSRPGYKLSKQNHASAIDNRQGKNNLIKVLAYLGLNDIPQNGQDSVEQILRWAIENWDLQRVAKRREIILADS